jgi:hypothetical protein
LQLARIAQAKIKKDQRPFYFIKMTLDITMTAAMLRHNVYCTQCRHAAMHSSKQQKQQAAEAASSVMQASSKTRP